MGVSSVLMTILIRVQMCDCAAYNETFETPTLTIVKIPWWWQLWGVETCRGRFSTSLMYIFQGM